MKPKPARPSIDWPTIHLRLEHAREAVEQGATPSGERKAKILRARAQALARPAADEAGGDELIEIVEFALAYETYAVESAFVREVHPLTDFTALPCTPPFVVGIVNVRGEIVSIVDIKKFFDLPDKGLTDLNQVIILQSQTMTFGILADLVLGVRHLAISEIQPLPPTLTGIRAEYLKGLTGQRLAVLDAAKLLADRRIIVHDTVEA